MPLKRLCVDCWMECERLRAQNGAFHFWNTLQRFLWVLKTIIDFHFLEIQVIFLIFKKINQCKNIHVSFRRKGEEHISLELALEVAEFFSWRFFQGKITFINIFFNCSKRSQEIKNVSRYQSFFSKRKPQIVCFCFSFFFFFLKLKAVKPQFYVQLENWEKEINSFSFKNAINTFNCHWKVKALSTGIFFFFFSFLFIYFFYICLYKTVNCD